MAGGGGGNLTRRNNKRASAAESSSVSSQNKQGNTKCNNAISITEPNRPRNLLITEATQPFHFCFIRCGVLTSITVQQTPDEATWPGGALWDIGVLLAQILVHLTSHCTTKTAIKPVPLTQSQQETPKSKTIKTPKPTKSPVLTKSVAQSGSSLPSRLMNALSDWKWNEIRVLELGCGVGLTGLVAAALGAKVVVLTDLDVVVDKVTAPNVIANALGDVPSDQRLTNNHLPFNSIHHRVMKATGGHVVAMPLYWGNTDDEAKVMQAFEYFSDHSSSTSRASCKLKSAHRTGRNEATTVTTNNTSTCTSSLPNLILIGDVAYQHKPGAPSHFEALQSTLMKFVDDNTIVLFGTRLRMPASADLLDMFLEQLEEIVVPPIRADEIDATFANQKHNMTIHILKKEKKGGC